jgi:DNA-binding SARP family transcriptional activator
MVGAAVEINVLGPVEVRVGGQLVTLPRRQMNRVLGLLALARPSVLGRDRLIDLLWPEQPPRRAHAVLQTRICELRASLRASAPEPNEIAITSAHGGYRLEAPAETVDAWRFESAVQRAREHDSLEQACAELTSALGLWRGAVLGGSPAGDDGDSPIGRRLESLRLTAAEDLFAIQLHRGEVADVLDDVLALSRANPDRERLFAEAMLALHASGRSAEALHRYDLWRRSLRDDLGVDPGSELQALHLAVLTGKVDLHRHTRALLPALRRGAKPAISPRTLPPDITDFAGREPQLRRLKSLLTGGEGAIRAVAVCGPGGVGKSAICVQVAHAVTASFPDGQIYLDLHGFDPEGGVPPGTALGRILRLLGVDPAAIPAGLDERVELYRQLTADRTLLVVLDNAASDDQVLSLLPGGTTSRVLINSRRRLGASFGATSIALEVLACDEAGQLLAHMIGAERLEREPQATARLVAECGGLPLALRIVAARLLSNPHCPVTRIVHQLVDERSKLNQFSHAHLDVRTTISLSYQGLPPSAKALLRRVADLGLRDVTVAACAAALDGPVSAAERELETLSDAQMLHACGQDSAGFIRYRLHDLVRLFSVERAVAEESEPDLRTARQRVLGHYLRVADTACGEPRVAT